MKVLKQAMSLILTFMIIIGSCKGHISTQAAESIPDGYIGIYNAEDLNVLRNNLSGKYLLMNDIDLSSWGEWTPIGDTTGFTGVFDGNGFRILNMSINDETIHQNAGLFSYLENATIKNIKAITGTINCDDTPVLNAGAVAGSANNSSIIQCASYVTISYKNGEPDGNFHTSSWNKLCAGGIVGEARGNTQIEKCVNANKITGIASETPLKIGGIVGSFSDDSIMNNCYNIADLSATTGYVSVDIGGITGGQFAANSCKISNCYNIGQLSGVCGEWKFDGKNIGGISGRLSNNRNSNTISNCYFNSTAPAAVGSVRILENKGSKINISVSAKSCDYKTMQQTSTYSGFDLTNVWKAGTDSFPFPTLRWISENNLSCMHKYNSANGNICINCGYEFTPELIEYNKTMYSAIDNAAVRNQPYAKAGTLVDKLKKGESIKVTHYFNNALGNKWYLTDQGTYIYCEHLSTTSLKTYTLTFEANGDKVNNLPNPVSIPDGVRYGIPGIVSAIPTRSGYTFIGYSTNKNATDAEYVPGRSIKLTKDKTLYAIWKTNSSGTKTVSAETKYKLSTIPGVKQENGTCTSAATAVLLARRQIVDGKAATFTYSDVRKSVNYSFSIGSVFKSESDSYKLSTIILNELPTSADKRKDFIIELLKEHPEGIVVYYNYGSNKSGHHAIVLSDYDPDTDTFYAYDSAKGSETGRRSWQTTQSCYDDFGNQSILSLFSNLNDGHQYFTSGICIWYIK